MSTSKCLLYKAVVLLSIQVLQKSDNANPEHHPLLPQADNKNRLGTL